MHFMSTIIIEKPTERYPYTGMNVGYIKGGGGGQRKVIFCRSSMARLQSGQGEIVGGVYEVHSSEKYVEIWTF